MTRARIYDLIMSFAFEANGRLLRIFRPHGLMRKMCGLQSDRMTEFLSLQQAIEQFVRDGDTIALEGFTHLIPFAAGHEIIRQNRRDLTLIRMTPDILYDQMIGMGVVRKLGFLGRQSRRWLAASTEGRHRKGMAASAGN